MRDGGGGEGLKGASKFGDGVVVGATGVMVGLGVGLGVKANEVIKFISGFDRGEGDGSWDGRLRICVLIAGIS